MPVIDESGSVTINELATWWHRIESMGEACRAGNADDDPRTALSEIVAAVNNS